MQSWNKYNCPEDIFCELLYICFMKWPNLLQDSVLWFHRQVICFFISNNEWIILYYIYNFIKLFVILKILIKFNNLIYIFIRFRIDYCQNKCVRIFIQFLLLVSLVTLMSTPDVHRKHFKAIKNIYIYKAKLVVVY